MSMGIINWRIIDPQEAFDLWMQYGSVRAAHLKWRERHPEAVNRLTGKPPTAQAIFTSAWRYVLTHLDVCKPKMIEIMAEAGEVLDDEKWKILITVRAKTHFTKARFERFVAENHLEPYLDKRLNGGTFGTY